MLKEHKVLWQKRAAVYNNCSLFLGFARHGHNLTGASPKRSLIAASVQPKARVSVAMRNLKEAVGKSLT